MTPEKISCGICRDLLPLVLDGVAAPESFVQMFVI